MDNLVNRQEIVALEARIKALENVVVSSVLQLRPPITSQLWPPDGHLIIDDTIDVQQTRPNGKRRFSIGSQPESCYSTNKLPRYNFEEDDVSDRYRTPSAGNVTEVRCDVLSSQLNSSDPWLPFQCNNKRGSLIAQIKR